MKKYVAVLRLKVPVRGARYDSAAGERRTIMWSLSTPAVVAQARASEAIDWGGAMVRASDYEVLRDDGRPAQ